MAPRHLALLLSAGLLALLLLLGLSLQLGWRRDLARWPHHALFFAVCAGVLVAGLLAGLRGLWLLPALALLLTMPRTKPGRANHWQRALLCAAAFGLGVWGAW
ncbi:hypothetical protein [Deinococcus radiodurans]|uniref:Uncharacterized protein n=1 Tax=Deinococcus radiodurans (strain ATCC 13939 / DSM 20539 / JCM 16871 / CCUG 27074 / LMG 4051 / NBRC 15346 / NCIMB 9279 / VKM B-1422 / R1) TaxID=243230 RepID=Q9RUV9_DEIRA|nr:hypothetical protein [Deinococcus radiodurans]AAF10845.1 hypothetical protein DR_1272 [Deinococcus radiodurans R1 = ATCC 13939 = DSM 20539]ANC71568.1 hypothetical protein A2G07_07160 [Deinococcus radiodurans R1 = ATCC 13939 = DSM 20539]QEM70744.1 hypothetical protein DXG80_02535 [Deinococcus radiodurans]QIP29325.1 hypothetical protein HAV23_09300 [Deinococcus radiodurans]QIP31980.1 hypothetical protein HAV35_07500 [Deinococcus radiodurans]